MQNVLIATPAALTPSPPTMFATVTVEFAGIGFWNVPEPLEMVTVSGVSFGFVIVDWPLTIGVMIGSRHPISGQQSTVSEITPLTRITTPSGHSAQQSVSFSCTTGTRC